MDSNDLYVIAEARKLGVGRALMERARQLAEATRANCLTLETASDNLPAQRLYEGLGWKRDEEFYRFPARVGLLGERQMAPPAEVGSE